MGTKFKGHNLFETFCLWHTSPVELDWEKLYQGENQLWDSLLLWYQKQQNQVCINSSATQHITQYVNKSPSSFVGETEM